MPTEDHRLYEDVARLRLQVKLLSYTVVGCSLVLGFGLFWTYSELIHLRAEVGTFDTRVHLLLEEQARLNSRIHDLERRPTKPERDP